MKFSQSLNYVTDDAFCWTTPLHQCDIRWYCCQDQLNQTWFS